jgi:hypothetical protein
MSKEEEITWVTLTLNFPQELDSLIETRAHELGLSPKCYCVHVLHRHLLKDAADVQKERWTREFPATLRRNGCDESFSFPAP